MTERGSRRTIAAINRQFERESQKRRRELERQAKQIAKLSVLEQARLEVETFENSLDVLLSIHKEPRESWDWISIAAALKPSAPQLETKFELQACREALTNYSRSKKEVDAAIQLAREADKQAYQAALEQHQTSVAQIETLRQLANRILDGEGLAFLEAFAELNPVAEFSSAGSLRKFAVERKDFIDCVFKLEFDSTIPTEVKALTASGKLSVKPMPKARRYEIYQDYVSACALRMAGEVFAMLPVKMIIVTALADVTADAAEKPDEIPILSVAFERPCFETIDFETVSPADAIDQFQRRCNFKITRGTGAFQPVTPLTLIEVATSPKERPDLDRMLALVKEFQDEIRPAAIVARTKIEGVGVAL